MKYIQHTYSPNRYLLGFVSPISNDGDKTVSKRVLVPAIRELRVRWSQSSSLLELAKTTNAVLGSSVVPQLRNR